MRVLFHANQLGYRGVEVALYDYAHYNETILGNESYIASSTEYDISALQKFTSRFSESKVFLYQDFKDLQYLVQDKIDVAYFIKAGFHDGKLIDGVKNIVHVVFQNYEPHGDKYIYIAEWLSNRMSGGSCDFMPHIIHLDAHEDDLRKEFGIPPDALVFGRHGGYDEFNLSYVHDTITTIARNNSNIYFLFMNTKPFTENLSNVIYLQPTYDLRRKREFINTCDCMIHARQRGEVFSMSIGEFLYCNKPVISSLEGLDRGHLYMLRDKGLYYTNHEELFYLITNFQKKDYQTKKLVEEYSPERVMYTFKNFLEHYSID